MGGDRKEVDEAVAPGKGRKGGKRRQVPSGLLWKALERVLVTPL
jgi:hypothetical protein